MEINKIKVKDNDIEIIYDLPPQSSSNERKTVKFLCDEEPRVSFFNAMNALLDEAIEFCGLDPDTWSEGEVTGVTLKHSDDGVGINITVQSKINDLAVVVNTPHISKAVVSNQLEERINKLLAESEAYIQGQRSQMSLFDTKEEVVVRQFQMQ
ncbi:hypothetical protein FNW02_30535 [Komarekiella sp. 'clone 1']|uniref:Uncharacterized protein n=1 Tax=Komarekiella delphini-convector SJRDD-AB1 TaxID=2593771 RepID=A0AA40T3M6_9NOST|nr:hypothetical protein [Komarekiella delphini-convector]MBD6620019.1 hypothetical protein [Komarekiella delphini-convector SJRDD-AB1]